MNDLLPAVDTTDAPVSLRSTIAETPSGLDASLGLLRARSPSDVLDDPSPLGLPTSELRLRRRDGEIGYHAAGLVPRRERAGYSMRDANDPDDAWNGFYSFDDLPQVANPERGWVATANNVPWSRDPWYVESGGWSDGYRATSDSRAPHRERQAHAGRCRRGPRRRDSIRARDLVSPLIERVASLDAPLARAASEALGGWDFRYTTDSVGASIWTAFWVELCRSLAQARFPEALQETATLKVGVIARRLLLGESLDWLDGNSADGIQAAFQTALSALEAWGGADPNAWQWGKLHQLSHPHPLAFTPALRALYQPGPFPTSGGSTVRATGNGSRVPFTVTSGSTYRFLADLSRPDAMFSVQTLGQSANPASPHFQDQIPLWLEDRYHPLWMNEADVAANTESEVRIEPVWTSSNPVRCAFGVTRSQGGRLLPPPGERG